MGRLARFFGFASKNGVSKKEKQDKKGDNDSISDKASFVTEQETQDYSTSIMGQLLSQEVDLQFIIEYLPENGRNLMKQSDAIKRLLLTTNNEQDPEVIQAFERYMEMFRKDYQMAQGLSTIAQLEDINKDLNKLFTQAIAVSGLNKEKLLMYVDAIKALQLKIDEAEQEGKPILKGPSRQLFNDRSLESEYRLKMLEILCVIAHDEYFAMHNNEMLNPFRKMSSAQKVKFPILFKKDLEQAANDYGFLAYSEKLINEFGTYKFTQIDSYAEKLDIRIGTQQLRDYTFRKMFSGDISEEELFENIKRLVYMRYKLNEMAHELPSLNEKKLQKEQEDRERQEQKEAEIRQKENERKQKEEKVRQAEAEVAKVVNATDEEIQAKIDELNRDVTQSGSRFVNILDFQKMVAKAKGLLPADDMIQDEGLIFKVFDSQQIITFIKYANQLGVNYIVFPDSQEGANGGFNVLVSKTDKRVFNIPELKYIFSSSGRSYVRGKPASKWKKYGTIPGYFLQKLQELYDDSEEDNKEIFKDYAYVDKRSGRDVYEIGMMKEYGNAPTNSDRFMTKLIKQANKELGEQWTKKQEDKDIMCYISIPATHNMIPILQQFKNAGIVPYFERVPDESKRNSQNRDDIHIYFYRKDFDEFWYQVRAKMVNAPDEKKIPFEVHYGENFDFRKENPCGLNLPMLDEDQQEK